ncbi:pseudouridine synthase deg1 [Naganishia albida]|nr:pseudouridine synthase deg1 [Naganishia albida]
MAHSLHALSKEQLIDRILNLEAKQTPILEQSISPRPLVKQDLRAVNFHQNATRKIALLFTYQGWHYSGLALQNMPTPLPTVEGELLKALEQTYLIQKDAGLEACGFARCGRTDRGVSSAGQVVTLWVRSKRKPGDGGAALGDDWRPPRESKPAKPVGEEEGTNAAAAAAAASVENVTTSELAAAAAADPSKSPKKRGRRLRPVPASESQPYELAYAQILNRVLPAEIRVIGWSPLLSHADFDARFSCQTRHYRYFFNKTPIPGERSLNLDKMQQAADRLLGEHDFRNFCKVDGSKQIENHCRKVLSAVIRRDRVGEAGPGSLSETVDFADAADDKEDYVFELVGSAFLWHQVRHIMAILFLVGHELEEPSIVSKLLYTGYEPPLYPSPRNQDAMERIPLDPLRMEEDDVTELMMRKPLYAMASGLPLQLYRCNYKEADVDWRYSGYDGPVAARRGPTANEPLTEAERLAVTEGSGTLLQILKNQLEEAKIQTRHIQAFFDEALRINHPEGLAVSTKPPQAHTVGAGDVMTCKKYIKLMDRTRSESVEEINRKWMAKGGEKRRLRNLGGNAEVASDDE